jgi:nucleotide-binding universal stress UspA family protein
MYKTILVHVDETARSPHRTDVAMRLAKQFDSHLIGAAMTGLSPYLFPAGGLDMDVPAVVFPIEQMRAEAKRGLDQFDADMRKAGMTSCERRLVDDEAGLGISLHGRYSDLVVISQSAPDEFLPRLRSDFPEYVLLNCARPVLVLPVGGVKGDLGQRITVAWNGSAEAIHAVTSAIPMLKLAAQVDLVVFDAGKEPDLHGEDPGADIALYLARHGIRVTVSSRATHGADGDALLSFAAETGADLIVMGAYGRSRFREFMLGGMSRTALSASPVALWMAH